MRVIFMGTPEFAVPSLDMLIKEGYEVVAAITQPDRPKGRGNKLAAPPVKEHALKNGIKVIQPVKVKNKAFAEELRALNPDLLVTVAYGKILPDYVLNIPKYGCINVHGSLLPKYRGAAPIQWAIINGELETGITTMYTDVGMDTGDMLLKKSVKIPEDMTFGELHNVLMDIGAEVLRETLEKLKEGILERTPQPHEFATYTTMISKELGHIDWNKPALYIKNLIRGTNPWPGAYTFYKGERMRIWKAELLNGRALNFKSGTICEVIKDGIVVATGDGLLNITEIQFDSSKRLTVDKYLVGHKIDEGEILG